MLSRDKIIALELDGVGYGEDSLVLNVVGRPQCAEQELGDDIHSYIEFFYNR